MRAGLRALFAVFRSARRSARASGKVFAGANIENASYPEGWCAETSAIAHMVMAGERKIAEVAVVAEKMDADHALRRLPAAAEGIRHGGDAACISATQTGIVETVTLGDLLPKAFGLE